VTDGVFYFGCWKQAGHYLFCPGMRTARGNSLPDDFPVNYGSLDGSFLPQRHADEQGKVRIWRTSGWAIVAFADRSVDSRPGSNSAFVTRTKGNPTDIEIMRGMKSVFPEVFKRINFPLIMPDGAEFR